MRANINVVAELPIKLVQFFEEITRIADQLEDPTIWNAEVTAEDSRDGQPALLALTITGRVEPAERPF